MRAIPVLHLITRLIVGGAQENTMYTAAMLDKRRFRVDVLCGPQTGSEGSLIEEVRAQGVPLTILSELLREVSPLNDWAVLIKMARLMRSGNYTIVHTHSSKAGILGRMAAKLAGIPVIVHTVHGWSFHDHMSPAIRLTYILLERLCARLCDTLIVVTNRDIDKGQREKIGKPEQFRLIRSAIPLEEFDPVLYQRDEIRRELGLPLDAPVLGNIGRFSTQKNPLDWVRVAGKVNRALPGCWFLLVGDGPLRSQVEELLVKEGIASHTILTGLRRDVPRLLATIDVFLLTSLWEGLPRVIPQSLAMRTPVVANRADGTLEAISDGSTGYLCDPGDLDGLAAHCLNLLTDTKKRTALGDRGRAFSLKNFDLKQMLTQIEDLYLELLDKKNIPLQDG